MEENILLLVGLPEDFASVKPKLELHFRNKRKSGGEVSEIRNYPNDKRKALLVYLEDEASQRVLEKGPHKVDFKELGVVELQVRSLEADNIAHVKIIKPVSLPKPRLEKEIGSGKSASYIEAEPRPFHQEGLQQDGGEKVLSLLVSSDCPIKKEILQLYFEQFTDDIDICGHGDNQWILKLTSHSDLENILAKKDHVLEGSLMSVQLYDEREAKERLDPHRFILSGFSEDCKCSHLSVFIKSCSRGAEHSWEILNDGQRIAVTFKQDIDVEAFLKKCSTKKLQSMDISASRLEYTNSVLVKGNMENISEKELKDYFSSTKSNGGQVKCLDWVKNAKSALLVFEDFHVAHRVAKEKHTICGVSLCAFLFYCNLNQALTGETPTMPPFPPKISIPVDALFLEYIQNDEECIEDFESTLKEQYTSISFKGDPESPELVLEMAVDRESLLLHRLAHTWERKTKKAVEALLEKYSIVMFPSTKEVWERIKNKCLSLNLKTARVSFERDKNTIVVLGQQNDVKKLQGEIQLLLIKAKEELDVEKNTVERKIPVDSKEALGFVWNLVSEKLEGVEHLKDEVNLTFHLKGFEEKVNEAERIIKNTKDNLSIQTLQLSPNLAKFLQSLDLKKFERNHLTHISATVFSCGDSIQILAEKLQDGEKAREKIKEVLMEDVINLTPDQGKVTQEEHWRIFYSGLMQEVESSNNARNVKISHSDVEIAVCGFQNVVTDVARKLRGYLNNKMPVTEDIPLKSLRQVEYVADCMKMSEAPEIKALDATILSSRTQAIPCLKVTAANDKIKEAVAAVEKKISNIVHEKHIYSDAGESKVLEKHQDALKARAKEFACKLYLTVEQASHTSSHLACRFKMGAHLTLTIAQGELSQQTAEAVICPLGGNLSFDNPVAQKILQVGGPQTKESSDKLLKESQALVAGDVVEASPGNLPAKALFYAVIPTWGKTSQTVDSRLLETRYLASAVQRSLENADKKQCVSMVMPALGCGAFGFPVRESFKVIEKEISEFCSSLQHTTPNLREIFIIDSDAKTVEEFYTILKEMGYRSPDSTDVLSPPPANKSKEVAPPPHLPKPDEDLKVVIGGVTVILKKGDITKEAVDAIVNSTNSSLNLDTGVSGAILNAAGESVVDECTKLGTQKGDGVVVTGGGNLKCKHIIQMVGPTTTAGITTSTERVLQLCEKNSTTSVSIPSIGTGRGNIKPEESIEAILKGLQNHLSQITSTSIIFIFIVAFEQKVFDSFRHYFAERNRQFQQGTEAVSGIHLLSILSRSTQLPVNQVVIGGVTVILKKGDITKEAVDAIVNSTNSSLNLDTGVSGAILKAAGKSVVDECAKLGTQKEDGVVVTGGGNLKCKHIIQMVGPTTTAGITTSTERVLQLCESKSTTSVSIPAIGTGRGNIKPEESIEAILKGLQNHLSQTTSTSIIFIFIVAFEQTVFDSFRHYFAERNQQSQQGTEAVSGIHLPSIQSRSTQLPANQVKIHGIRIEVKKGDITTETVRGIVNTTNNELNLKGGVSGAIFRAAGSSVEQECKKFGPQQDDGVVVTSGGALDCDFIIHMVGPRSLAAATSQVEKVLEQCEKNSITTVSFPAIGTGGGQLKAADVIDAMLQGFHNHLSQQISTVLKLIYIVVKEDKILQEFLQGLKQWSRPGLDNSCDEDEDEDDDVEEDDYEGSIEIIMGPMKVKALCGDVTNETTDVIVNSTNTNLDLNSGVSGAILKAAGQTVLDECRALGTQPSDGVVVTKPGNLKSKHIVHMVGQTMERTITNSMYKVLETCDRIKAQSVTFPALGTGAGNLSASQVANAMIDAISNFVLDKPKPSITTVHIVIFQPKMMSDFEHVMKKFKRVTPKLGMAAAMGARSRPSSTSSNSSFSKTNSNIPTLSLGSARITFPVMVAEVYGVSVANLAQVKKCLDDLVSEECTSQDVVDKHLHHLTEKEKQDIIEASQRQQVRITMLQNKLTVSGKRDDVLSVILQIKDSLQRAQEREDQEREESRIWQTVRWEVGRKDTWTSLKQRINYNLELAFHRKDKLYIYQHQKDRFTVDFEKMQQTNSRGQITRIKRTPLSDCETAIITTPPTWTKMDGKDLDIIVLSEKSNEYQKICKEFVRSCQVFAQKNGNNIEVVQIQRIQHQEQWRRYTVSKQALDKKYPKNNNEQFLYHGTTKDICQKINKNGFNRSFCGRNATAFGSGTYFAKEAHYSCDDKYSNPDENGHKYMYRARVLTGKHCLGLQGMREPSPVDPNNLQAGLHDCAVNNLQNPFIFVIFSDSGAYPEYLITFKTV